MEAAENDGGFEPLASFHATNKTLSLVFASFGGTYMGVSEDLWLSAHQEADVTLSIPSEDGSTSQVQKQYSPDSKVSVLACTEQFQTCNPAPLSKASPKCSPLLSRGLIGEASREDIMVLNTDRQWNISRALVHAFVQSSLDSTIFHITTKLLAESLTSGTDESLTPAENQWVLESQNWFSIGIANAQRLVVDYITGPPAQFAQYASNRSDVDKNRSLAWLCENLIIRRNDFTNFSTLAISLVFGLGALIIVVSLCLETVVGLVRSKVEEGKMAPESLVGRRHVAASEKSV